MSRQPQSAEHSPDPVAVFADWYTDAIGTGMDLPNAMTLATASSGAAPSARIVLMKHFDYDGFVFFTNYGSRKGRELARNRKVALAFWWPDLRRQVRIEGSVQRVAAAESEAYFQARPRGYQLGAWASRQSRTIAGAGALRERFRELTAAFKGKPIPRPAYWGGYRVSPTRFEFWTHRENRLHKREEYRLGRNGTWRVRTLSP